MRQSLVNLIVASPFDLPKFIILHKELLTYLKLKPLNLIEPFKVVLISTKADQCPLLILQTFLHLHSSLHQIQSHYVRENLKMVEFAIIRDHLDDWYKNSFSRLNTKQIQSTSKIDKITKILK